MVFGLVSSSCVSSPCNMASAMKNQEVIREYLANECSEGRVLGPLDPRSLPQVNTSHFGVIPKGSSGGWRLILDLSFPEGFSVNDGIDPSMCGCHSLSSLLFGRFSSPTNIHTHCS